MRGIIGGWILTIGAAIGGEAIAAPLEIDASASVGEPGSVGTGACIVARQPSSDRKYVSSINDAASILNASPPPGAELRRLSSDTDFANGTVSSLGDFSANAPMPFSPISTPQGSGETIAMRLIGVLRIPSAGNYTFAVRSDDGAVLQIAGQIITAQPGTRRSRVDSRTVYFAKGGRYRFELTYFENLVDALLEWAVATTPVAETTDSTTLQDLEAFSLVAAGMLLPPTDDARACGQSCVACPPSAPACEAGSCVTATSTMGSGGTNASLTNNALGGASAGSTQRSVTGPQAGAGTTGGSSTNLPNGGAAPLDSPVGVGVTRGGTNATTSAINTATAGGAPTTSGTLNRSWLQGGANAATVAVGEPGGSDLPGSSAAPNSYDTSVASTLLQVGAGGSSASSGRSSLAYATHCASSFAGDTSNDAIPVLCAAGGFPPGVEVVAPEQLTIYGTGNCAFFPNAARTTPTTSYGSALLALSVIGRRRRRVP